jgi:hypothetical protein
MPVPRWRVHSHPADAENGLGRRVMVSSRSHRWQGQDRVRAGSGKAESTFSAFWLSFGALLPGLGHGWFGVSTADVAGTQELYFISWACLFVLLVIPRLKLPAIYPLAVALVFAACACRFGRVYQLAECLHRGRCGRAVLRLPCLLCLGTCRAQGNGKHDPAPLGPPVIP